MFYKTFLVYNFFMENEGKKVLIVGASSGEYVLAQKIAETKGISKVYVAPGNDSMRDFSTTVDIKETNSKELLEFVLENAIDFTIVSNESAIKTDIASLFQSNGQMIFAPTFESAGICLSKAHGKKFMYKNRIPCPKFGIFDKITMAIDYVKNSKYPIVVKTDEHQEKKEIMICNSFIDAKNFIEDLFASGEKRIIVEEYIHGHEFSFYVVTDGYHALPLGSVATYKHELDGHAGSITDGMGSFAPDYKISKNIENIIMNQMVYPTLDVLAEMQIPYTGVLGLDLILDENEKLFALEYNSFLQNPDCNCILSNLDENLFNLFEACVVGSFADDYESLDISDSYSVSCVICSKKPGSIVHGLENLDDDTQVSFYNNHKKKNAKYTTKTGPIFTLTRSARVLSRAVDALYDEVSMIDFEGIHYRRDIGLGEKY